MIVYKNYISFVVLGQEVNLISDDTDYGRNTIAEILDNYYYLGDEYPNIATAIITWQEINNRELTIDEMQQTLINNQMTLDSI